MHKRVGASFYRGLPVEELAHPATLIAVAVLGINDWVLKPHFPFFLTGKLSDFAGIFFFPLLLTALLDTLLFSINYSFRRVLGFSTRINYSLTNGKLFAALGFTCLFFTALKLSASFRSIFASGMAVIGMRVLVSPDPTDLTALTMLFPAYLVGRWAMKRVELLEEEAR